jgi:hypothetical protein
MISNKVILNTMTSIRLAGEVVNYLSKEAWEQFRRQNRVIAFFNKKENEDNTRVQPNKENKTTDRESLPRREKIYFPRVMINMMQATTTNSTSIHYGTDHMCKKHKVLFNLEQIEKCD